MHTSDWFIIVSAATIMAVSLIAAVRHQKSFLGVWVFVVLLAGNTLWLNHYVRPWGALVFCGLPSLQLALAAAFRLRRKRVG